MGEPLEDRDDLTPHAVTRMRCDRRDAEDDFFCLRYQVWYPSRDCAIRTKYRTAPGCLRCEQGRFNLRRHAGDLAGLKLRFPAADDEP